jgi:hypothetical protein
VLNASPIGHAGFLCSRTNKRVCSTTATSAPSTFDFGRSALHCATAYLRATPTAARRVWRRSWRPCALWQWLHRCGPRGHRCADRSCQRKLRDHCHLLCNHHVDRPLCPKIPPYPRSDTMTSARVIVPRDIRHPLRATWNRPQAGSEHQPAETAVASQRHLWDWLAG